MTLRLADYPLLAAPCPAIDVTVNGVTTPPPPDLPTLQGLGLTPAPDQPWFGDQRVPLGDGSAARWDGSAWVAYQPPPTTVTAGAPGTFGPAGTHPAVSHELSSINGGAAWTTGQYVDVTGNAGVTPMWWDGATWRAGMAP